MLAPPLEELFAVCDRYGLQLGLALPEARSDFDPCKPVAYTFVLQVRTSRRGRLLAVARGWKADELPVIADECLARLAEQGVPIA